MTTEELLGALFAVALLGTVFAFWLWMLRDCLTNEPSIRGKLVWTSVIVFANWLGAVLYFLIRRPKRRELFGK